MATSVSISGDAEVAARLHRVGKAAGNQAPVMAEEARKAARGVRGVPVDTGTLSRSIGVLASGDWGYALGSIGVPYARYVFRGTSKVEPRPPELPASMVRDTSAHLSRSIAKS